MRELPGVAAGMLARVLGPAAPGELLSLVLDTVPIALALIETSDGFPVAECNAFFEGLVPPSSGPACGRPFPEMPAAAADRIHDTLAGMVRTREAVHFRHTERAGPRAAGRVWNWDIYPVVSPGGAVGHLVAVGTDITGRTSARRAVIEASEESLRAVLDVSRHVEDDPEVQTLLGRLSRTIAGLVGARAVIFCTLEDDGTVTVLAEAHGVDSETVHRLCSMPCPEGDGSERMAAVVHRGQALHWWASLEGGPPAPCPPLFEAVGAREALLVPWWAGERHLGALVACDASSPRGFSEESASILRVAGLAAGLVWQLAEAEGQLAARREAEATELRRQRERMEELESIKSQFLNLAAHELRGPVTVLRGYLSMLEDGSLPSITGRARDALPLLLSRAGHINRLIDDMLDAARLEEGRIELVPEIVDLGTATMVVIQTVGPLATPRHHLRLTESPSPVMVRGDWNRIHTMLADLVENAIKYSPDGGEIECSVEARGDTGVVVVRDQGLGIPPEEMGRLFTRFGRTVRRETSHIPGSGLGLYLARELARLHGGDVTVESTPGAGSAFTLTLPLAQG